MYEVELKFPLADAAAAIARLEVAGGVRGAPIEQRDRYFAHPCRDFRQTNEALRIRTSGDANRVTYKGPIVDSQTKTRREIEIPFADGPAAASQFAALLGALGFVEVHTVIKRRTPFRLAWEGRELEVTHDEVAGLGDFMELETTADEAGRAEAQASILRAAAHLGLENPERRSYLELLLELGAANETR